MPQIDAIRFRKYKSFGEEYSTIPLKRMTVLIGRNNSGKSSCIDVIEAMTNYALFRERQVDIACSIHFEKEEELDKQQTNGIMTITTYIPSLPSLLFNIKADRKDILDATPTRDSWKIICKHTQNLQDEEVANNLAIKINNYYQRFKCLRLNAERDISPEIAKGTTSVSVNGIGATNFINLLLNKNEYNEKLIQRTLLSALNEIMYPDATYSGITVQKIENNTWEVFLYEDEIRYPLSKTGSGLKTIILVLLNMVVIPLFEEEEAKRTAKLNKTQPTISPVYLLAFEELENNLHPALQRRLFDYIDRYSKTHSNIYVFLTTHSHVPINMFADQEDAQILHVTKENSVSSIQIVDDFITKSEVLNDLDVRASDLLQSNGIIWVEGPSDRIYIKHWMEIWGGADLREGVDYQFLYYGGRLLSHYTADEEQAEKELIGILTTNRNSAIVIDSDKRAPRTRINATKRRIQAEFQEKHLFCWITQGKEIENYLSCQAINSTYGCDLPQCGQFELFPEYIEKVRPHFQNEKVRFASNVIDKITREDSESILDLKQSIIELIKTIQGWTSDKISSQE